MSPVDPNPTTLPQDDLAPGTMIGQWRVERELGRGGMGTVYAVRHVEIGKSAALKLVHRDMMGGSIDAASVLVEARAVNAFSHPNVVDIFESGTMPDGRPYLVMERLEGRTLGDRHAESRMSAVEAIDYLLPLCDALAAAHEAGIVHRDIKLDNVFLAEERPRTGGRGTTTVKLVDWGVASINVGTDGSSGDTLTIGTPRYVAPEQVKGEGVTAASDIYALGVVAYELFLEEPPFNATTTAELLLAHVNDAPPMPHEVWPKIPPVLEELLLAMLCKNPAARPSARRVAAVLTEVRDQLRERLTGSIAMPVSRLALASGGARSRQVGSDPTLPVISVERGRPWRWLLAAALIAGVFGARELVASHGSSLPAAAAALASPAEAEA
ncbi:MAG TPA: serine/threonine-protein kinase, partial [Kofleriaceae bacterium]|nr:serine/threonine-protein kinase [Kofleriaceae bacterium]